jgi:hypothetical protein
MNQEGLFKKIEELHVEELDIIRQKNKDYSNFEDPFANFRIFGELGFLVRMSDKLMRLKQIRESGKTNVIDETYEDSIKDLSNYCNLLLAFISEKKEKENEETKIND